MTWGIVFLLAGLAIVAYSYLSSQDPVAKQHQVPVPEGDLTAIEYFWRPG